MERMAKIREINNRKMIKNMGVSNLQMINKNNKNNNNKISIVMIFRKIRKQIEIIRINNNLMIFKMKMAAKPSKYYLAKTITIIKTIKKTNRRRKKPKIVKIRIIKVT